MTRETAVPLPSISQEELLSFLLDPHSYPHEPKSLRLIQTHAAYVIIASPFVYKIKKPVDFGFLDFATLEKRHYYSKREVELNQRLCPEIYLGIVPISIKGEHLVLGEGDRVVEYAIKMRRLPDRYFLKRRLKKDDIGPEDLDRVALKLKSFYDGQAPREEMNEWSRIEKLKISTDENFRQIEDYIGLNLSMPAFETVRFYTNSFYAYNASLFDARVREGWIRDCHGDLHLEHIHLSPRSICIYDCIEFNDRFRYIDVANDIAFLAMDLDCNGRPDLARFFVARMAHILDDPIMLQVMDFYKCYRATVLGKVESFRSSEREVSEPEKAVSRKRAQRYFRLALQYAVLGSEPTVLAVMGNVGSGKTTLAMRLAKELGWEVFSSDRVRKELAGIPLHGRSKKELRSWLYSDTMKEKTYEMLLQNAEKWVREGRGVILDATFGRGSYRNRLRKELERLGVPYYFIETKAPEEVVKRRLLERETKDREVSDARLEDFEILKRSYEPPTPLDSLNVLAADTERELDETLVTSFRDLVSIHLLKG
ncbi:MAG: AAA family ATPase [Pseudomonadota bacterium]